MRGRISEIANRISSTKNVHLEQPIKVTQFSSQKGTYLHVSSQTYQKGLAEYVPILQIVVVEVEVVTVLQLYTYIKQKAMCRCR